MNSLIKLYSRALAIMAMFSICNIGCTQNSLIAATAQPNPTDFSTFFSKAAMASGWKNYVADPFWKLPKKYQIAIGVTGAGLACVAVYKGVNWLRNWTDSASSTTSSSQGQASLSVESASQILQHIIDNRTLNPQQKQATVDQDVFRRLTPRNFNTLLSQANCHYNDRLIAPIRYSFMIAAEYNEEPTIGRYLINRLLEIHTKDVTRSKIYCQLTKNAVRSGLVSYLDALLEHPGYPKERLPQLLAHAEVTNATTEIKECINSYIA